MIWYEKYYYNTVKMQFKTDQVLQFQSELYYSKGPKNVMESIQFQWGYDGSFFQHKEELTELIHPQIHQGYMTWVLTH